MKINCSYCHYYTGDVSIRVALIKPRAIEYINWWSGSLSPEQIVDINSIIDDLRSLSSEYEENCSKSELNSIIFDLTTIKEASSSPRLHSEIYDTADIFSVPQTNDGEEGNAATITEKNLSMEKTNNVLNISYNMIP